MSSLLYPRSEPLAKHMKQVTIAKSFCQLQLQLFLLPRGLAFKEVLCDLVKQSPYGAVFCVQFRGEGVWFYKYGISEGG